jgi:hypothetical protein
MAKENFKGGFLMVLSRGAQKVERVTITLVPTADERSFHNVPTTFSPTNRSYEWRHSSEISYMLVPKKISSSEILVDLFINPAKKGKLLARDLPKIVQSFVQKKIESEWRGLKLGGISRPTAAIPPQKAFVRGTIEEMLGADLGR